MNLRALFLIFFLFLPANLLYAEGEEEALELSKQGGEAYQYGRFNEALSYFEKSLEISRRLNILKLVAANLNNIGLVYDSLSQFEKALSYYEESLKISRELNIPQNIAVSRNNIGLVYGSLGQFEKALTYYEESLKIVRELNIPQYIALSLNNIGLVYDSLSQFGKALSYYEESLKISRELNIPQDISLSLNNIGGVYNSQKRFKEAETIFIKADKELEKTETEKKGNPYLADVYIATERYDEALKLLDVMKPGWNTHDPYRIQFHTQYGLALKGKGKLAEASYEFLKAVSISEEIRQRVNERTAFLSSDGRMRAYRGLVATLSERAIRGEKTDEQFGLNGRDLASNAFYFSESTKARTLIESMAESAKRYEKTELPAEIRAKEESIVNQLSAIENLWEETYKKGAEGMKSLIERKGALTKELDALVSSIRVKYPRYAALNYPRPVPAEKLPLKDNEILLEYAVGDDASYLFRVSKNGVEKVFRIAEGKEELEKLVGEFILPMQNREEGFSPALGRKLYSLLLEEALKDLSPDKSIIVVPDGILGLLPFEALVITPGKDLRDTVFVGDKWKASYYQSATVLALNRGLKPPKAKKPLFALGNPIYDENDKRYIAYKEGKPAPDAKQAADGSSGKRGVTVQTYDGGKAVYPPLPETETEVKQIANLFGAKPEPPDILLNVSANETGLRKSPLNEYRYLHFATHADLPGKIQGIKEPFILLGQVENKGGDDGFLTLGEVLGLRLDADMVVLSACVTGRGKITEGEGVVNFARSFHYAGARSVVVSLWEVASEPTVEYMNLFYRRLKEGKEKADALSLARREMKAKYPNPLYWAAFILHGER